MISVCKKFGFCYGHKLPGYDGKCSRYHGHNADVEVEVVRTYGRSSYDSMIMDFRDLKDIVDPILEKLDHFDLTEFFDEPPIAETICKFISNEIRRDLPKGVDLVRIRVSETPTSWAEWRRDQ